MRLGGSAPVVVQSMTNTDTADYLATALQTAELARAGSELVRITVNTPEAAAAVPKIRDHLDRMGCDVPLIGDFHYNGHRLLTGEPACAEALAKYRINPGNVGFGRKKDEQFAQMVELACRHDRPVRIGVNWGSLDHCSRTSMVGVTASSLAIFGPDEAKGLIESMASDMVEQPPANRLANASNGTRRGVIMPPHPGCRASAAATRGRRRPCPREPRPCPEPPGTPRAPRVSCPRPPARRP